MQQTLERPKLTRLRDGINHVAYTRNGEQIAYSDVHMNLVLPGGVTRNLTSINDKVKSTERIRDLVISWDGKRLSAPAGDHVYEFDAETGEELWRYVPARAWGFLIISPLALAGSASGLLAASTDNGHLVVWDADRAVLHKLKINDVQWRMTFAGNSDELVGCESFALNRMDARTGKRTARFELPDKTYGMALSPDGSLVAVRTLSRVYLLDGFSGQVQFKRPVEAGLPLLAFHPTKLLLAIGENYHVLLVDLDGEPVDRIPVENAEVISVAYHPAGTELSIGCSDGRILRVPA